MRSRRRVRVSGARRVRAVIFCEGLRVCASTTVRWSAAWPAIIDRASHDRLVGLLDDPSRRRENFGRPRVHPLVGLVYCASCGGRMTTAIAPRQGRGYGCRKDESPVSPARVRIVAEPLEAYVEGYVIDRWRDPEAIKIARSDDERMMRIREVTDEMRHLQEQKEALRMRLQGEVDAKTFREVTAEIDAAHDQLAREHNPLASEAAMPELPDPSLAWEDLSAGDRRALTGLLVDKIIIAPHPHKIDKAGRRHYTIRSIPYQDPGKRLSGSRRCTRRGSRSSPGSEQQVGTGFLIEHVCRLTIQ
jgi:hypothetical protein